ncbi:hypothetical protein QUF64_01450 [Anaerolineales bacterium HSG6]|nr:hypothetical protein [Anaerolineales bacterium HSG6]MDM8532873.1 hypothetical protein [Anaerolineales bacterium HSG25]
MVTPDEVRGIIQRIIEVDKTVFPEQDIRQIFAQPKRHKRKKGG